MGAPANQVDPAVRFHREDDSPAVHFGQLDAAGYQIDPALVLPENASLTKYFCKIAARLVFSLM
jgi:hypothetical protein